MNTRIGFRQCGPRFGFLWLSATQPESRWHGAGEGARRTTSPTRLWAYGTGVWAEFLRHEGLIEFKDRRMAATFLVDGSYAEGAKDENNLLVVFSDPEARWRR